MWFQVISILLWLSLGKSFVRFVVVVVAAFFLFLSVLNLQLH